MGAEVYRDCERERFITIQKWYSVKKKNECPTTNKPPSAPSSSLPSLNFNFMTNEKRVFPSLLTMAIT